MVQFLSINFFSWISSIFVGFSKVPVFFLFHSVFANKSGLLVKIKVRHRIGPSVKRHDRRNGKKKLEEGASRSLRHTSRDLEGKQNTIESGLLSSSE